MSDIKLEVAIEKSPISISINDTEKILFQMKNCICKVYNNRGGKGTGFFCKIPFPDESNLLDVLFTANHILNEEDIKENNSIYFSIDDNTEKKSIFINEKRKKYTYEDFDVSLIEIKPEDNIIYYLDIDDVAIKDSLNFIENSYKNKSIYIMHYPKSEEVRLSIRLLKNIKNNSIIHLWNTSDGSSGAPIVSLHTEKVLGVHIGGHTEKKYNLGVFMKNPIVKFYEKYKNDNIEINSEYLKKIEYQFIKEPQKLKYKYNIINTNDIWGANDLFEIFISYKDNLEYIVSPNFYNYNLDILALLDNHLIKSLKGHQNHITTIRYFINNKNYKWIFNFRR